jgi:hypothetical protein
MTLTEQMKADGWVEHDGGPCPVHWTLGVEYIMRGHDAISKTKRARNRDWSHTGAAHDIIAYRSEQPQ